MTDQNFLFSGRLPAQSLHSRRASAQAAPVHGHADPAAGCHVRHRILAIAIPKDDIPHTHPRAIAIQVSDSHRRMRILKSNLPY